MDTRLVFDRDVRITVHPYTYRPIPFLQGADLDADSIPYSIKTILRRHHQWATRSTTAAIPIHIDGMWYDRQGIPRQIDDVTFFINPGETVKFQSVEYFTTSAHVYGMVFSHGVLCHIDRRLSNETVFDVLPITPLNIVPTMILPNTTTRIYLYVTNYSCDPCRIVLYHPFAYVRFERLHDLCADDLHSSTTRTVESGNNQLTMKE